MGNALLRKRANRSIINLETVDRLDLSGKGILFMPRAEVLGRMTNLKRLDISNHPEFFLTAL